MKISEFIKGLEEFKKDLGDIEVVTLNDSDEKYITYFTPPRFIICSDIVNGKRCNTKLMISPGYGDERR